MILFPGISNHIVDLATTAAGTLATSFAAGQTIDGIVLATDDKLLIKNQASGVENGIYIVGVGAPTRYDFFKVGDAVGGYEIVVQRGTVNHDTSWVVTNDYGSDVVGTNSLAFTQQSSNEGGINGPGSSTDRAIVRWNGTAGTSLFDSNVVLSDAGGIDSLIYLSFVDAAAPAYAGDGFGRMYKGTGDSYLLWKPDSAGEVRNLSEPSRNYRYVSVNAATYSVLADDEIVGIAYSVTGECTVTLPQISTVGKKKYMIVDEGGNAKKETITIVRSGTDTILGETAILIEDDYNSLTFYNNGVDKWLLY